MKNSRRDFIKLSTAGLTLALPGGIIGCQGKYDEKIRSVDNNDRSYELWLWIELIEFDNTQPDYGVKDFIKRAGFIPKAFSILITRSDFVSGHFGMDREWVFPPDYCSYGGRPHSKVRERQDWTNYQLRDLVQEFHKHGMEVYFSSFSSFVNNEGEGRWGYKHPEVWRTGKNGKSAAAIYAPKRFKDGTLFADFFKEKLGEVMDDYGFDGWHASDGFSPYSAHLSQVDYSDDNVGRFLNHTGVELPGFLSANCESDEEKCIMRSDWIWQNKRKEWIGFMVDIWTLFYQKVAEKLHQKGKKIILNSTAHIDPFESVYRCGFDFKQLCNAGVDRFTVYTNEAAAVLQPRITDWDNKMGPKTLATLMLIKAEAPKSTLIPFTGIHDTEEEWDNIHHVPTVLEREIYSVSNFYLYNDEGKPGRCSSGTMGMLSDSLTQCEWEWMKGKWDLGYSNVPGSLGGITLLWSDKIIENQVEDYIKTRRWSVHKLLYELMALGAPVYSACNIKSIDKIKGPVLVLNPNLFSQDELKQVLDYSNGPIVIIGGKVTLSESPEYQFEDVYPPGSLYCAVYNSKKTFEVQIKKESEEDIPRDYNEIPESSSWTKGSYFRKVSESFLDGCISVISGCIDDPKVLSATDVSARGVGTELDTRSVQLMTHKYSEKEFRLFISNKCEYYVTPTIEMKDRIEKIIVKTDYPPKPAPFTEKEFRVRVPGRGMVILDIILV